MSAVYSVNGVRIRLTEERWGHIVAGRPGIVQEGAFGELVASRFYEELGERGKYIFTVYREVDTGDGLIMTAYMDERRSDKKVVVWTGP